MTNERSESLRVSLVQTRLSWHDPADNRAHFQQKIAQLDGQTDVVVLPETFTTGFTSSPHRCKETMDGETLSWMATQAQQWNVVVCGSVAISVDNDERFRNRFIWMQPDGQWFHYDKKHLFTLGGEGERYRSGDRRVVVEYQGWRICPQICYDLRFPVWCRNRNDYDVLIFVANWPISRKTAWQMLLRARAIENQAYVVGVNRIGEDGNGLQYAGDSAAVDFLGSTLVDLGQQDSVETVRFNRSELDQFRDTFQFQKDADAFAFVEA